MIHIPEHLKKYIISQDDHNYSFVEHSTWRYILHQLTFFLRTHAHETYLDGLKKAGISLERIPQIKDIAKCLEEFGWTAMPVSGFIPPAAFMELQSLGVLPIATEMRSFEHLHYTPAPDIVHEAAGHAPLLANPEYSDYLKAYAKVSRRAILSIEDLAVYKAIRILSDLKENRDATPEQLRKANCDLEAAQASIAIQTEAALLARMNWWTAEYGLIGDLTHSKIYGAGLLSSVGESQSCFDENVKKIPLTIDCINYSYDITEPQPQLFVTPSFEKLKTVLSEFASTMAYQVGGIRALQKGIDSRAVTSCRLNSGIEIGGVLETFKRETEGRVAFIKWTGPCQLAYQEKELPGHDTKFHASGFSTAIGYLENSLTPPHLWTDSDWKRFGFQINSEVTLEFVSGLKVTGTLISKTSKNNISLLLTLSNALMTYHGETLFYPTWGIFNLALGTAIESVWGGAPDRAKFPDHHDFESIQIPKKILSPEEKLKDSFFETIHSYRTQQKKCTSKSEIDTLENEYLSKFPPDPLFSWECEQIRSSLDV